MDHLITFKKPGTNYLCAVNPLTCFAVERMENGVQIQYRAEGAAGCLTVLGPVEEVIERINVACRLQTAAAALQHLRPKAYLEYVEQQAGLVAEKLAPSVERLVERRVKAELIPALAAYAESDETPTRPSSSPSSKKTSPSSCGKPAKAGK